MFCRGVNIWVLYPSINKVSLPIIGNLSGRFFTLSSAALPLTQTANTTVIDTRFAFLGSAKK